MARGFVNFDGEVTGALPPSISVDEVSGTATVTAEELEGSLSGIALRVARSSGNVKRLLTVPDADAGGFGEVVMLVRMDGNFATYGVLGNMNDDGENPPNGLGFAVYNSGGGVIRFEDSSGSGDPGSIFDGQHTFGVENYTTGPKRVWMRFQYRKDEGNPGTYDFKMKAWDVDAEEEPETWDHDEDDINPGVEDSENGVPGAYCNLQGGAFGDTMWIEAIGWSTDPDVPAPLEPVGGGGGGAAPGSPGTSIGSPLQMRGRHLFFRGLR